MAKLSDVIRQIALDSFSKPFRLYNWHLFLFFNNEIYICMGVLLLYMSVPHLLLVLLEARPGHWIPWKWSYRQLRQLWATMWELNPGCLEEKSVLLTAEPTLQPLQLTFPLDFLWFLLCCFWQIYFCKQRTVNLVINADVLISFLMLKTLSQDCFNFTILLIHFKFMSQNIQGWIQFLRLKLSLGGFIICLWWSVLFFKLTNLDLNLKV